ncbi:DUF3987 domain-containing protein [Pseudodesulfovibrio sp. zrk46]|uniref:DUF3987 domain-containing protein n=1 Tax=Pseudodesulfovibrio sp. zrk46 TaxID=2725288 RepID=UPI0014494646|nr:DUF3987 domain-containing protein [Pseudodesulfovibrio sp. zrk46]QJB55930.1 DUF3987 domain-containing protein [Pseudodesulfovibrio sp. zrk46]
MNSLNLDYLSNASQLDAALHYAEAGFPVFPCDRSKAPKVKTGFMAATTDLGQIRKWWTMWPGASIGIPTGAASGVFVLDIDMPNGPRDLDCLESEKGRLPDTLSQRTGSGGLHHFYAVPDGFKIKNKVRVAGTQIDVRGHGGYVIVPPSLHPSGNKYIWSDEHPVSDAPEWLFDWIAQDSVLKNKPTKEAKGTPYVEAAFDAEVRAVRQAPEGARNDTLNKAAYNLAQLVGAGELDQARVETALLEASNLPDIEKARTIKSGMDAGKAEPRSLSHSNVINSPADRKAEVDVMSFVSGNITPVQFDAHLPSPVSHDLVPGLLRDYCVALSEFVQVPFELALCAALGAISVAGQKKYKVEVFPGHSEPINIYSLCALPPGERKSAVVENCKAPLKKWEMENRQAMKETIEATSSERKTLLKAIEHRRSKAASASSSSDREKYIREIRELEQELPEVPVSPRLLADDFTPEALAEIMSEHDQKIGLIEAEGGIFETFAGRYTNGIPNIDGVLKFWGNESVSVDRKGKEPIYLGDPALTLCVCPQPDVVQGLAEKAGFKGRGLLGRLLYFMPQSRLGTRIINAPVMPERIKRAYEAMILGLLDTPWLLDSEGNRTHYLMHLDSEAKERRDDFAIEVEKQLLPEGEFEHMTDWAGKLPGMMVRIAALLQLSQQRGGNDLVITGPVMKAAIGIAAVLVEHAKKAFSLMGTDAAHESAKTILKWFQTRRLEEFSGREALRGVRGRFSKMAEVNAGLDVLVDRCYLYRQSSEKRGRGRKPSDTYVVNPYLMGE